MATAGRPAIDASRLAFVLCGESVAISTATAIVEGLAVALRRIVAVLDDVLVAISGFLGLIANIVVVALEISFC